MKAFPREEIEQKLGYTFHNANLIVEAFTHASYVHNHGGTDNDRLEYLGDAVLELVVSEWQFRKDAKATAGQLTAKRQKLVCKRALDTATDALGVWEYLLYDGSEENLKGKAKSSLFEAITAAIYLDGGLKAARKFILEHGNVQSAENPANYIGELKEFLEKRGLAPVKETYTRTGKDNAPIFHCILSAQGETAEGDGKTKREARAIASARLLWELENKEKRQQTVKKKK